MRKPARPLVTRFAEIAELDAREDAKAWFMAEQVAPHLPGIDPDTLWAAFRKSGIPADLVLQDDETARLIVENARLKEENETLRLENKKLSEKVRMDDLTKISSKSAFEEALRAEIIRMHRHENIQIAVVYIDLQYFKFINDTYGHITGDRALRRLARALQKFKREEETIARLHGDEFCVLLYDETNNNNFPIKALARLRKTLKGLYVLAREGGQESGKIIRVPVIANVGYALRNPRDIAAHKVITPQNLEIITTTFIDEADKSMRRAKRRAHRRLAKLAAAHEIPQSQGMLQRLEVS